MDNYAIFSYVLVAADTLVVGLHCKFNAIRDGATCNPFLSKINRVANAHSSLIIQVINASLGDLDADILSFDHVLA